MARLTLEIDVTQRCNLRCSFCFSRASQTGQTSPTDMPDEVVAAVADWLDARPEDQVQIRWIGTGEPMLRWEWMLDWTRKLHERLGDRWMRCGMVTNATILPEEFLAEWHKHGWMMLSIDGTPEVQRALRGTDPDKIAANAKRALAHGCKSVRTTVTPDTVEELVPSAQYLYGLGFKTVSQVFVYEDPAWTPERLQAAKAAIHELADWCVERKLAGDKIDLKIIRDGLGICKAWDERPHFCGAGRTLLNVAVDGGIYPCHRYSMCHGAALEYLPGFGAGVTLAEPEQTLAANRFRDRKRPHETMPECADCPAKSICAGGCPWVCNVSAGEPWTGAIAMPPAAWCELLRMQVAEGYRISRPLGMMPQRKSDGGEYSQEEMDEWRRHIMDLTDQYIEAKRAGNAAHLWYCASPTGQKPKCPHAALCIAADLCARSKEPRPKQTEATEQPPIRCQYLQICAAEAERAKRLLSRTGPTSPTGQTGPTRPTISLVTIAFNEGDLLEETLRGFRSNLGPDAEILVVDDGSTDGCADPKRLAGLADRVIRNEQWRGIPFARNQAWEAATGDVVVFIDAHVRVWSGDVTSFAMQALETGQVGMACNTSWLSTHRFRNTGGSLVWRDDCKKPVMLFGRKTPAVRFEARRDLNGMCYAFPRSVLDRIGGWVRSFRRWGSNEAAMTLKCWFAGIPLFVDRDLLVGHYYRTVPYPAPLEDRHWNRYALFRILLDDPTYWLYWRPLLASFLWKPEYAQRLKEVEAEAAAFKAVKVRTDAEFFREFLRMDMPFELDSAGNVTRLDGEGACLVQTAEWLKKQRMARRTWSRELLKWAYGAQPPAAGDQTTQPRAAVLQGRKLLDVGCRDAQLAEDVAKLGGEYTGIEIVPAIAEDCRTRGLNVFDGSGEDLSHWPDEHFDVVTAGHVLEHSCRPAKMIAEMCRVASDCVLIEVPSEPAPNYAASHLWAFPTAEALVQLVPRGWTAEIMRGNSLQRAILRRPVRPVRPV